MAKEINQQELLDNVLELREKVEQAKKHLSTIQYELIKANEAFAASWNDCQSPFVYCSRLVTVHDEWWEMKDKQNIVTIEPLFYFEDLNNTND